MKLDFPELTFVLHGGFEEGLKVESTDGRNLSVACDEPSTVNSTQNLAAEDTVFLRGLLSGIRCGVLAIDRQGDLVLINRHGCEILGYENAPPAGTPAAMVLADHPQFARMLGEAFSLATLPNRAELDLGPGRREGTRIGFTVSHVPGQDGDCAGAAVFFKDLTRIERSEEQERLKDRLAALGEMAARLAHEVRNPLASIQVTCGLLRRRLRANDEDRELLDKISAEVRRLNETVTSSLEFVKPAASNFRLGELEPLLAQATLVATDRHAAAGVSFRVGSASELPAFRMDPSQLRQVFENLLLNAAEAVGSSGNVVVEIERVPAPAGASVPYRPTAQSERDAWGGFDELVVVRVSDDGPGIPDDVRERIFHPFFTTKRQGSGVGLSTVKKIVDSHGGLIDVDRSSLGGARFTVRIPMMVETTGEVEGQQQ